MAAGPADRRAEPADLLLGDLNRIEAPPGDLLRETAELAERIADAFEQLRMFLGEEARAEAAAVLLVREHGKDHVARERDLLARRARERMDEHRHAALHVERAASPHVTVDEIAREGGPRPLLPRRRHHVDVPL